MILTKFGFHWFSTFRGEDFLKSLRRTTDDDDGRQVMAIANQKQELPIQPCLLTDRNEMSNLYRGPSKDASYQVSVHLAKRLQRRRFFRNQPIRNKNCLWRPCLITDRDEMSNLYRGPAMDASYQVSVHLAQWFQRRRFLKIGQSETRIAYGGHVCEWIGTK
jgi:hypothetical protein